MRRVATMRRQALGRASLQGGAAPTSSAPTLACSHTAQTRAGQLLPTRTAHQFATACLSTATPTPPKYRTKQPHVFCTGSGRCPTCGRCTAKAATGGLPEARASEDIHASSSGLLCRGAAGAMPAAEATARGVGRKSASGGGRSALPDITDNGPHCIHCLSAVQGSRVAHAAGAGQAHNKWAHAQVRDV